MTSLFSKTRATDFRLALVCGFLLVSCSTEHYGTGKLELDDNVRITIIGKDPLNKGAGETMEISGEPAIVEAPGKISVILVPRKEDTQNIKIKLPEYKDWGGDALGELVNERVSKIMDGVLSCYKFMEQRRLDEALSCVVNVKTENPGVAYLDFLHASVLIMRQDYKSARSELEKAMLKYPNHGSGKELLNRLSSDSAVKGN